MNEPILAIINRDTCPEYLTSFFTRQSLYKVLTMAASDSINALFRKHRQRELTLAENGEQQSDRYYRD